MNDVCDLRKNTVTRGEKSEEVGETHFGLGIV